MRLLSLPAIVLGIVLAIVFFEVYGYVSRPSVPRPIAFVVGQFAPGVEIGANVSDARYSVAAMTYVPHLGYVGIPGSHGGNMPDGASVGFAQVRLLLDEQTRAQLHPNPARSRIDAVEVVSAEPGAASQLRDAFERIFRRPPRDGCIRMTHEERLRDAHIWTTPNERGGLAVITDVGGRDSISGRPALTSVLAFAGKFQGGRTLRADYVDASCSQLEPAQ